MSCNACVDHSPGSQFDNNEDVYHAEQQIMGLQKVARPDVMGVIMKEGCPILLRFSRWSRLTYIFLHGPLADPNTQFEQFTANPLCAP